MDHHPSSSFADSQPHLPSTDLAPSLRARFNEFHSQLPSTDLAPPLRSRFDEFQLPLRSVPPLPPLRPSLFSDLFSDSHKPFSRSVPSMPESFSKEQVLSSTSEKDTTTRFKPVMQFDRDNGVWDPLKLLRIFSLTSQSIFDDMIELRTPAGWKAVVHKYLLCHYSLYYRAAIQGQFKEATSDHFDLALEKQYADVLILWLYSGKLSAGVVGPSTEVLFQLYIFADEKDILALRRDVMSELVKREKTDLPCALVALATNSLLPSAALYRYLVDWHVQHWIPSEAAQDQRYSEYEALPKEFMHLVMCRLAIRARTTSEPVQSPCACCNSPCSYHEHATRTEWIQTCKRFHGLGSDECPDGLESSHTKKLSA